MSVRVAVVDFETKPIERRPDYPPEPVGVALWIPGQRKRYLAWGHPAGNDTEKAAARHELLHLWKSHTLIFHNAAFDLEVAEKHLGLPIPPWDRFHDTMLLAFLKDPNAPALGLKQLGEKLLGRAPAPQESLRDWILAHVAGATKKNWGAFISEAPVSKVRRYALEDVTLTWHLYGKLKEHAGVAYDRERRLLPILLRMSQYGLPLDVEGLQEAVQQAEAVLERTDLWLRRRLKKPDLDLDKGIELANALEDARLVPGGPRTGFEWLVTEVTERRSVAIPALRQIVLDQRIVDVLEFRSLLTNQLRTFARPWLRMGGRVSCNWNQVRHHEEKRAYGARTGRISSTPNLQNVPRRMQILRRTTKGRGLFVPIDGAKFIDLRSFIRAPRGHLIGDADYSQQELRVLAHYTGGKLAKAYNDDPHLDMHAYAQRIINEKLPVKLTRDQAKGLGLGIIYGMGLNSLSERTGLEAKEARSVRWTYKQQLGIDELDRKLREAQGCKTWGGRWYDVESPKLIGGQMRDFEYKLINTIVQGSSADCTKEAMIRYDAIRREGVPLLTVHDELVIEAPEKVMAQEMKLLAEAMESVEFQVPMVAEGKAGKTWREAH